MSSHSKLVYQYLKINKMCVTCGGKNDTDRVRCASCYDKYNRIRLKPNKVKVQMPKIYCNNCKKNVVKSNGLCDECYEDVVIPDFLKGKRYAKQRGLSRIY